MKHTSVLLRARQPFGRTSVYVPHEIPEKEIPWPKLRPIPNRPSKMSWWTLAPMAMMGLLSSLVYLVPALSGEQPLRWSALLPAFSMVGIPKSNETIRVRDAVSAGGISE